MVLGGDSDIPDIRLGHGLVGFGQYRLVTGDEVGVDGKYLLDGVEVVKRGSPHVLDGHVSVDVVAHLLVGSHG